MLTLYTYLQVNKRIEIIGYLTTHNIANLTDAMLGQEYREYSSIT